MTRGQYLDLLEKNLSPLPRERVREIISDIFTHFDEGEEAGLSEAEIASALGAPEDVAREYLSMYISENGRRESATEEEREPRESRRPARFWPAEEEYDESWSFPLGEFGRLALELKAINLELHGHVAREVRAEFHGWRAPDHQGEYPAITFRTVENGLTVREEYPARSFGVNVLDSIIGGFPRLRGTLTVYVPTPISALVSEMSSGRQSIDGLSVESARVECASGSIEIDGIRCANAFTSSTNSGSQKLRDIEAGESAIRSTSGSIRLETMKAQSLTIEARSGSVQARGLTIENDADLSTNSGSLKVQSLACAEAKMNTSSGSLNAKDIATVTGLEIATTSGGLHADGVTARTLSTRSTSGSTHISEATAETVTARSASGSIRATLLRVADVHMTGASGSVELTLPHQSEFRYDLESSSGRIVIGFDGADKTKSRSAHGAIGEGTHHIAIGTASGSIQVKPG